MGEEKITQSILVVGGGISGTTAAIEAAEAGYDVILVEKNPYLGDVWRNCINISPSSARPNVGWRSTSSA